MNTVQQKMLAGEKIGKFKTLVNSLQMNYKYEKFHKFERENLGKSICEILHYTVL